MSLQTLDPAIALKRGAISFIVVAAGRVDAGTMATVQVMNGTLKDEDTFLLSSGDLRDQYAARFAQVAYMSTDNTKAALLEVLQRVEVVLQDEPWGPPVDLYALPQLPTFPTEVLPTWLGAYVRELAEFSQTPVDLGAMIALSVLATCGQRIGVLEVQPGYDEPLGLYTLTAMHSGERKSAIYKALAQPIYDFEAAIAERDAHDIARRGAERRVIEQALLSATKDAAKKDALPEDKDRVMALTKQLQDLPEVAERVLVLQDSTPEALVLEMSRQHGCIAALDAEGGLLDSMTGRYSDAGPNLDPLLKAHAGDEIRVARVARGRLAIKSPSATLGIAAQPDVLRKLAEKEGAKARGLLGRFLYSIPTSRKGTRKIETAPVRDATLAAYRGMMARLLGAGEPSKFDEVPARYPMRLGSEAYAEWLAFCRWLEPQLAPDAPLGSTDGWAEKLGGQVARIAALFHLGDGPNPYDQARLPVTANAMARAIRLGTEYLIPHALGALRFMGVDPVVEKAAVILGWLERRDYRDFSRRDVYKDFPKRFGTPEEVQPALDVLESCAAIRPVPTEGPRRGRKHSVVYCCNPGLRQNRQNRQSAPPPEENSPVTDREFPNRNRQNAVAPNFVYFGSETHTSGRPSAPEENIDSVYSVYSVQRSEEDTSFGPDEDEPF